MAIEQDLQKATNQIEGMRKEMESLHSALGGLIVACESNTGHEPSLSVYHQALDNARYTLYVLGYTDGR